MTHLLDDTEFASLCTHVDMDEWDDDDTWAEAEDVDLVDCPACRAVLAAATGGSDGVT